MQSSPDRATLSKSAHAIAMVVLATAWATTASVAEPKPEAAREAIETIRIDAKPILSFSKSEPARRTFGKLEFRGGLVLSASTSKFGGWSALEVDPDGRRMLAISDAGLWLTGTLTYDGTAPNGIANAIIGPITGVGGVALAREGDRDAEGAVLFDGSLAKGTVLISFERNHRIGRFPISDKGLGAPTGYLPMPADARRQSANKSLESVCVLRGGPHKGAIVTLSERFPDRTGTRHTGWMLPAGAPPNASSWTTLTLRNIDGYDLTDCRGLADGSLLVLERRFRWSSWYEGVKSRLRRFTAAEVRPGSIMQGEILLDTDMNYEIDNLEGLSVHYSGAGETILTMISDNNYNNFLQRTVLLQFTLNDQPPARAGQAAASR